VSRKVLVVAHPRRKDAHERVQQVLDMLSDASMEPRILADEAGALELRCAVVVPADELAAKDAELVLVLGASSRCTAARCQPRSRRLPR
jgi:NAD+ kinase